MCNVKVNPPLHYHKEPPNVILTQVTPRYVTVLAGTESVTLLRRLPHGKLGYVALAYTPSQRAAARARPSPTVDRYPCGSDGPDGSGTCPRAHSPPQ
jgi:hypothetical protein